jgi:hypothetical protein
MIVSTVSLLKVAEWFGFDLAELRRWFRINLVMGGSRAMTKRR